MRAVVVSFLSTVAMATAVQAKEFRIPFERKIDAAGVQLLELTWVDGACELTTTDSDEISITAVKRVDALTAEDAADLADHIMVQIDQIKSRVTVQTRFLRTLEKSPSFWQKVLGRKSDESFGSVDWQIAVPAGIKVELTASSGTIKAGQLKNDLTIKSSACDIGLSSIEGAVSVDNGSGETVGDLIIGPVSIRQSLGRIDLQFVEGDIRIKSSSASISISQEKGALDLTTTTGDVDIRTALESARDCFVTTESGHIHLAIPESSSAQLKVSSETGEIKTEMPVAIKSMTSTRLEGTFGLGGVRIALTSMSGDVSVAQY
ncbi:MAG: DUF4097 family beta strand repeat protein [candidate division Zixibacteria bacterium]|nr:DUF4097 family beta strand repeat protein [candidate division Zixibacteria bacterium]